MCTTCGCSAHQPQRHDVPHAHAHAHAHAHDHEHAPGHPHRHPHEHGDQHHAHHPAHDPERSHDPAAGTYGGEPESLHALAHGTIIELERQILAKNQVLAERNRRWLAERRIVALNLLSAPGAGKTTLLERTLHMLGGSLPLAVVEGDQATSADADRIRAAGAPVVQINTGTGCHLEADMLARGLAELAPPAGALVMIENVGNLVCPALFDLGERAKVVILSVTEGEDKPLKYPHMFRACEVMLLNKIDLLAHLSFDVERCIENAKRVNPRLAVMQVSAATGQGMDAWCDWLHAEARVPTVAEPAR